MNSRSNLEVEIKLTDPAAELPRFATDGSAGFDIKAMNDGVVIVDAGKTVLINTGIAINIKNINVAAMLLPRSGLGHKHGIVLGNLVGLIDSDYQGEVMISCWNRGTLPFTISPGDRIAQMIFVPIIRPVFRVVNDFEKSGRGDEGFGSTGKN